MNEKELKISIPGTKLNIYAKQYGSLERPVAIFVHGLTGFMDEHQFYNGARYFHERGFSSVRFNLYDYPDDSRKLLDCILETHAQDIDIVADYLKSNGANKIFAAGHSYGAPSIVLSSQEHLDAVALWDGTDQFLFEDAVFIDQLNAYMLNWNVGFVIGKAMYDEAKDLKWEEVLKNIKKPVKFIWAGEGVYAKEGRKIYEDVTVEKSYSVIEGAGHIFSEERTAEQLFDETLEWFKKHL